MEFPSSVNYSKPKQTTMSLIIFVCDEDSHILVHLAAEILGSTAHPWNETPKKNVENGLSIWAMAKSEFDRYRINCSVSYISISLSCFGKPCESTSNSGIHYEYNFTRATFVREDFVRFLSFITGQSDSLGLICKKQRSYYVGMTFPKVNIALPNLAIVSVGADALELRVDLLENPSLENKEGWSPPGIDFVAAQLMALRNRTELPIIFTIRFDGLAGRWPLSALHIAEQYLQKALQWGVEFLDVQHVLGEEFLTKLAPMVRNTKIIASYHDMSGNLDWESQSTKEIYKKCCRFGDVVQIVGVATRLTDNYELENFRRWATEDCANRRPLIALNTRAEGKLSRILNPFLEPMTHHLLLTASAPHQLTIQEANNVLTVIGQISPLSFYILDDSSLSALLLEKCFNELGLPHKCTQLQKPDSQTIESIIDVSSFGGALIPPSICEDLAMLDSHSSEAQATGIVDTIAIRNGTLIGHNCLSLAIRSSLLRHNSALAYSHSLAIVVANSYGDAASLINALINLHCEKIHILGFKIPSNQSSSILQHIEPFQTKTFEDGNIPLIGVFSALPADKVDLLPPLLRMAGRRVKQPRIFMDLVNGSSRNSPAEIARATGWRTVVATDIIASTTVERLRILADQAVPYGFLKMVQKRGLY